MSGDQAETSSTLVSQRRTAAQDEGWDRFAETDFERQPLVARVRRACAMLAVVAVLAAGLWLMLSARSEGVDARFTYVGPERERSIEDVVLVEALDPGSEEYTSTVVESADEIEIRIEPETVEPERPSATVLRFQLERPIGDRAIIVNGVEFGSFP